MLDFAATAEACELLSIGDLMKATPQEEAGRRYLYIEASNESRDYQGEVVLTRALAESADYYLRFGNLDLDHVTVTGPRRGPPNYAEYEIGRPVQVEASRSRTFVKAELFQGDAPIARNANLVWDSITRISPPQRWYPSVGGAVLGRDNSIGPDGKKRVVVTKVRWTNIGLSKTPVNLTVPTVSSVAFGALAKAWTTEGLDLAKALEMSAGASTDTAALTGGAALAKQNLDRRLQRTTVGSFHAFREAMAGAIRRKRTPLEARAMKALAEAELGLDPDTATEWTERMLGDLARGRTPAAKERN